MSRPKFWQRRRGDASNAFFSSEGVIDAKTLGKVKKVTDKIRTFAQSKRLNLKNSPPYLYGIMVDLDTHLDVVFEANSLSELKQEPYMNVFLAKLLHHGKALVDHFKSKMDQMVDEHSSERRKLNKETLVCSHMLAEVQAVYKDGKLDTDFLIVKKEAREFWQKAFGQRVIVPWGEFTKTFCKVHPFLNKAEEEALKRTMDLIENDYISWFEFDIFTRLFQPWKQLLNNWNVIVIRHPGYKAFITYDEVEKTLEKHKNKPGSYVFRLSCTRLGQWAIGFVTSSNNIVQTIPQSKSLYQALIDGAKDGSYIYPNGEEDNPDITKQIRVSPEEHIQVTKEQFDLYCDIDSTFELCKICNANMKSTRLDPCGHLLCRDCFVNWTKSAQKSRGAPPCPFCRKPILSTEEIVVDPFNPNAAAPSSEESDSDKEARDLLTKLDASSSPPSPRQKRQPRRRSLGSKMDFPFRRTSKKADTSAPEAAASHDSEDDDQGEASAANAQPVRPSFGVDNTELLLEMGFERQKVVRALEKTRGNVELAITLLTDGTFD